MMVDSSLGERQVCKIFYGLVAVGFFFVYFEASHTQSRISSSNTEPRMENRCSYHEEVNRKRPIEVHGIDMNDIRNKQLGKNHPLTFLKDFKNPCWTEALQDDYIANYKNSEHYEYGSKDVKDLIPVFNERLQSHEPWRLRCLPYFFIVGVTKSGTTDVYDIISMHPDVHTPWVKEPMYWNRHRYEQPVRLHEGRLASHSTFSDYVNRFDHAAHLINQTFQNTSCGKRQRGITLDGSSYTFWEDNGWASLPENRGQLEPRYTTANDLHTVLPDAKIIVMMRHPAERAYSAYVMYNAKHRGRNEKRTSPIHFDQDITEGIRLYKECFGIHGIRACAYNTTLSCLLHPVSLRPSFYSVFLEDWWKAHGKQQILVIRSEDYYRERIKYFDVIREFLGLDPVSAHLQEEIRKKKPSLKRKYPPMLERTKHKLNNFFQPFNQALESMLHREMWSQ